MNYITAGHGGDSDDPISIPPQYWPGNYTAGCCVKYAKDVGSFGVMTLNDKKMHFDFIDQDGLTLYGADIAPRKITK